MDVIFELPKNISFSIEVGFFDTVLEIKEKVEKYQGIPVSKQTLIFNGRVLQDDQDIEQCVILQNSRIQLVLPSEKDKSQPQTKKVQLRIKIPSSRDSSFIPLEMSLNDTVLQLKEKIRDMEPIPLNRLVVQSSGAELHDHLCLRDYEIKDKAEIDVNIRPSPTSSTTCSSGTVTVGGNKNLVVKVLHKCGTKKIQVEVNPSENVGELRNQLQKLQQKFDFTLPQDGYFFIYKQNVMDEDRSFRWHDVVQGDTIEIFNGSVTGGS